MMPSMPVEDDSVSSPPAYAGLILIIILIAVVVACGCMVYRNSKDAESQTSAGPPSERSWCPRFSSSGRKRVPTQSMRESEKNVELERFRRMANQGDTYPTPGQRSHFGSSSNPMQASALYHDDQDYDRTSTHEALV